MPKSLAFDPLLKLKKPNRKQSEARKRTAGKLSKRRKTVRAK